MKSIVVVGAGVIGASIAVALLRRGYAVKVLERGRTISEAPGETGTASFAAAGILGAQIATTEDGPLARLCILSRGRFRKWVEALSDETGWEVGYNECGVLRPARTEAERVGLENDAAWQLRAGYRVEPLGAAATRRAEPTLAGDVVGGIRFPDDARIDPPLLLGALRALLERHRVIDFSASVRGVAIDSGRAVGVRLEGGELVPADTVVVAAGSWSSLLKGVPLPVDAVLPARGQIVELTLPTQPLRGVVDGPSAYLSPRDDGRVLVGSTVEFVGYRFGATAGPVQSLIEGAIQTVPALADATVRRAWAGFRPFTHDQLPLLGETSVPGLLLATGHFRNGVLLSAITAEIVKCLVEGTDPPVDLAPFSAKRLLA